MNPSIQTIATIALCSATLSFAAQRAVVLGGGYAAVSAVEQLRQAGYETILISPRNHPAGMIASSNHAWLLNGTTDQAVPRPVGALQKELFARVMDAGAFPLLLNHCAGFFLNDDNTVKAIATASRYGTHKLDVDLVIDASEEQIAPRHLMGLPKAETVTAEINVELENAAGYTTNYLNLPAGTIRAFQSIKNNAIIISATKQFTIADDDWLAHSRINRTMRSYALELTRQIRETIPNMNGVKVGYVGEVRFITPERSFPSPKNLLRLPAIQLPHNATTSHVRNMERLNAAALDSFLKKHQPSTSATSFNSLLSTGKHLQTKVGATDPNMPFEMKSLDVVPTASHAYQALVVGGGTGGSSITTALADSDVQTLTVDMLPFLGGTTTAGGVSGNWHGYIKGAYDRFRKQRSINCKKYGASVFVAAVKIWDDLFDKPNAKQVFLGNAVACAAARTNGKLNTVTLYSIHGFRTIKPTIAIDATGDAVLCHFTNLPCDFGDPETGWIQSSSCWGRNFWTGNSFRFNHFGNDFDVVDPNNCTDTIRALALAHRKNSDLHISMLYTQREGRRIVGEHKLTVKDILTRKFHDDAIAVASCLFDSHGRSSSEIVLFHLTPDAYSPQDKEVHVLMPIGMFIPKGMDNLLVGAKAISGERDATCLARMNPEITNAGYALGLVATEYIRKNLPSVKNVDVPALRQRLHQLDILPDWAMNPAEPEWTLEFAAQRLDKPRGSLPARLMPKEQIVPILKERLANKAKEVSQTANLLTYFGETDALHVVLKELNMAMNKEMVSVQDLGKKGFVVTDVNGKTYEVVERNENYGFPQLSTVPPARYHGMINTRLVLLSHVSSGEATQLAIKLAERASAGGDTLNTGTTPYSIARTDGVRTFAHGRLWALAIYFRRQPSKDAIPALTALLDKKHVGGNFTDKLWGDVPYLQLTYLEIMLADALHRCGGEEGTKRLQQFTRDSRVVFRNMAARLLDATKKP